MTQLRTLHRDLASGPLAPAYLLRGDERWFREKAITFLRKRAGELELEVCAHDGADPDFQPARLLDDLAGGGLFAAARLVLVRNGDALLKKSGKADAPLTVAAIAAVQSPDFPGCVAIAASSLRADHKLFKTLTAAGGVGISCRRLWDSPPPWDPDPRKAELVGFVRDRAAARKLDLDAREAVFVAAATGNDLYAIEDQLEKLRHVPREKRREALGWEAPGNPFQLADAIVDGEAPKALFGLETLFRHGFQKPDGRREEDPSALFAVLAGSVRNKLRHALWTAHAPDSTPARTPRAREQAQARARRRPGREWRSMLDDLGQLERRARTGYRVDVDDLTLFALRWRTARR